MNDTPKIIQAGKLKLDTEQCKAAVGKKIVHLTSREYALLEYLMMHVNMVIPRKRMLQDIWGNSFQSFSNVIDVHIKNLRKKIESRNSAIIETVRGVGYRLKVQ